jgi:hypothetical protein
LENTEAEKIKFTPDYKAGKPVFWHVFKNYQITIMDWLATTTYKKDW